MFYFAYASNMSFEQLKERGCKNHHFIGPAILNDFTLTFNGNSPNWDMMGTANLTPSKGSIVWGGLFEVDDNFIKALNIMEHVPKRRKIIEVEVTIHKKTYSALTYVIKHDLGINSPSKAYLDRIITGARNCLIPEDYIAEILICSTLS